MEDEFRIVNIGNEPWKRFCFNMGLALDDGDGMSGRNVWIPMQCYNSTCSGYDMRRPG